MPLHHHSFRKKLEEEITKPSEFEDFEKEILQEAIKRKTNSVVEDNNSIFDYENVIECVVAEEISPEDYNKLGLFPQSDLSTLVTSDDRKRRFARILIATPNLKMCIYMEIQIKTLKE